MRTVVEKEQEILAEDIGSCCEYPVPRRRI
jgi:hypothetical protein